MATLQSLSNRLRAEIGDTQRSFVETFTGDGIANRFTLTQAPVKGDALVIKVNNVDVSNTAVVEEGIGIIQLATTPSSGSVISVVGTAFRYFTETEICYYVNTAFAEHARSATDSNGSKATMGTLPLIHEYPLIILASSFALYTLATDAAFDIDIISPDGVSIPRSERYRQLMEMVQSRKDQYRELCSMLGIGLYGIEIYTLRRISRRTNRYIPIYRPQEIDDASLPQRVYLSMPDYGDITPESPVTVRDLSMYSGDDFFERVKFSFDITEYEALSQVRIYPSVNGAQVGQLILATFELTKSASVVDGIVDTIMMHISGDITSDLPKTAYYDLQLTAPDNSVRTYLRGKVFTHYQVSEPVNQY